MSQPYTEFVYLEPPRTDVKRVRDFLDEYEAKGWWAQLKFNGTRNVTFVNPDREVFGWNRHGEPHRAWRYDAITSKLLKRGNRWNVFDSELMHNKTPHIKNINYLYDVLVYNGQHLTLTTYRQRYNILKKLFKPTGEGIGYYVLDDHFWLAQNFERNFRTIFEQVTALKADGTPLFPHIEGLVLKDPDGVYYSSNAAQWMVKFRRK